MTILSNKAEVAIHPFSAQVPLIRLVAICGGWVFTEFLEVQTGQTDRFDRLQLVMPQV